MQRITISPSTNIQADIDAIARRAAHSSVQTVAANPLSVDGVMEASRIVIPILLVAAAVIAKFVQ